MSPPREILMPLPARDFDPTESAIPWQVLTGAGWTLRFATPDGAPAEADPRMVTGAGLGPWRRVLPARRDATRAYAAMRASEAFRAPLTYDAVDADAFAGLLLPGGHAPGMRPYLESARLQAVVARFFEREAPVGAICHGVVLAARSVRADGQSVLHGLRTTALPRHMEMSAWWMTRLWLGDYYRTYPQTTVEDEVRAALADPDDFQVGPRSLLRDTPRRLGRGFVVRDGAYVSARWPGDAHRFAATFLEALAS